MADEYEGQDAEQWECHAIPAAKGSTCGHINKKGMMSGGMNGTLLCCEECGCTWIASEHRRLEQ
jgi:hypothetical protein